MSGNFSNLGMRRLSVGEVDQAMVELGKINPNVVVVNADLGVTTFSKAFMQEFPERSFDVGIAEQNQASFAAGLAHEGLLPYSFSRACFASMRACEQVRTDIAYGRVAVHTIAQGAGYSSGVSGATHCALEDVGIMTSMAEMTVMEASDPHMLALILYALEKYPRPSYVRYGDMNGTPTYADEDIVIGKALTRRTGGDGTFLVAGSTVTHALAAAESMKRELGMDIGVTEFPTIKPLDLNAISAAAKTGRIVVAQDHNKTGGLGSLVACALAEGGMSCKFTVRGAPDEYVPLATPKYLFKINGYDADGLFQAMKGLL